MNILNAILQLLSFLTLPAFPGFIFLVYVLAIFGKHTKRYLFFTFLLMLIAITNMSTTYIQMDIADNIIVVEPGIGRVFEMSQDVATVLFILIVGWLVYDARSLIGLSFFPLSKLSRTQ